MRTLQEKYNAIQEGKFTKEQFLRDARMQQPNLVTKFNGYDDAVKILKNRGMISEAKLTEDTPEESSAIASIHAITQAGQDAIRNFIKDNEINPAAFSKYVAQNKDKKFDIARLISGQKVPGMSVNSLKERKGQIKEDQTPKHKIVAQWMGPDFYLAQKKESDWSDKDHDLYDRLEKMVSTTGQVPDVGQRKQIKEISPDLFKRTIDVARGREEDKRVSDLGSTFFNSFKGKPLLGGTIVNITTEKPSHGSYFDVSVQLAIPTQREDGSSFDRQSFIYYDVDRDDWNMKGKEYFITRQDARVLSQIATKINPDSKYKQPAAHFDIQGTQYGGKLYGGVTEARLTKKNLADYRYKPTNEMDNYPYEQILRGLRVELETMGIEGTPTAEEYQKALAKVLKNLEKDEIFYTNQVAGVKANRKRTDLMVDATPKNEVDKDNGLQKAQLKEAVKNIIKNILSEDFHDPDLYDPDEEREERRSRYGQNEFGDGEEVYEMYAEDDQYICWDAGGGNYEIAKYDPNVSWHNDEDVFHGTYEECKRHKEEEEENAYRFRSNMSHKSYGQDYGLDESVSLKDLLD